MKALWLENQELKLRNDIPIPKPALGEALVRLHLAGICATDLEMVNGYYPFTGILGHEFVGEVVEAVGAPEIVGKRIVGEINISCGTCEACQSGRSSHCEKRTVLGIRGRNGVFAEYLTLPLANLHPVPASIPDEAAVFTEPLAAALEIQEQIHIQASDRVLIIGAGRLGQLIAQILALTGCNLQVVARHPRQRQLLELRGIPTVTEEQIVGKKMDIVIEATGSTCGFNLARQVIRTRGTIVLKSTYKGESQVNLSAIVVDEITLIGSRCGPFTPILNLLEDKRVDPTILIDAYYPLDEAIQAMQYAACPGVLKVLLTNPNL